VERGISRVERAWSRSLFRPVRDGNAFEITVERLAQAIKLGAVPAGDRLPPERELAERMQVSRVTLREAISALRQAGFVESRRGRGGGTFVVYAAGTGTPEDAATVARSMGEDLYDALEFRRVVEPGAAALAATRTLSASDRGYLRTTLDECRAGSSGPNRDSRLHLAIAGVAGCESLARAVADVQLRLDELLAAIPVLARNIEHSNAQHEAVVHGILIGDSEGARAAMEEHVDATSALLRGFLA
jgi:DNA-binding FadR family transcriptional regulator